MFIVLVSDKIIVDVLPFKSLEIEGKNINYENDEGPAILEGIKPDIFVVENNVYEASQVLNDEELIDLQSFDKKEKFVKVDLEERYQQLKAEKEMSDMALIELAQIVFGGMGGG